MYFSINKYKVKTKLSAWMFIIPGLISFTLFKYYPILLSFVVSFYKYDIMNPPGVFIGLQNYVNALTDSNLQTAMLNNVQFFCISMVMNFWVPIVLAILINEVRKGKTFFRMMYFLPAVVPSICIAILFKYIWQPDYGFANFILRSFHLPEMMWLNDVNLVKWVMRAPGLILGGGMSLLIYLAALQDIPEERYEASYIDGAGFFQKIRYITLPGIVEVIKMLLILQVIIDLNAFDDILVMTGGGPAGATETMVLYAYNAAIRKGDYGYASAVTSIVLVLALLFTGLQRYLSSSKEK